MSRASKMSVLMIEPAVSARLAYRSLFLLCCIGVVFVKLLPLSTQPASIPGPDLLFCLIAVWVMRNPLWAPVLIIVVVQLFADILFLRPLGLWSALSLVAFEFLRQHSLGQSDISFLREVFLVSITFVGLVLLNAMVFSAFGIPHASAKLTVLHIVVTLLCYPLVFLATHYLLGVRRAKPGERDTGGALR